MDFEMKLGNDLSESELGIINKARKKEFESKDDISLKDGIDGEKTKFIFLRNSEGEVISFGRIDNMPIEHLGVPYEVLCLSTVIALPKGKGYGRSLMSQVKELVTKSGKTMIGFCETKNLPFYEKCGFKIVNSKDNKFVFVDSKGEIKPDIYPGEVFYLDGEDELMSRILKSEDKTVKIVR